MSVRLPGEEPIYFGSGQPYTYDYAVMALLPNLHQGRKVLIMAGTNTYGCQGRPDFSRARTCWRNCTRGWESPKAANFRTSRPS